MLKRKVRGLTFGLRLLVSELFPLPFHLPRPLSDPGSFWVLRHPVQLLLLHLASSRSYPHPCNGFPAFWKVCRKYPSIWTTRISFWSVRWNSQFCLLIIMWITLEDMGILLWLINQINRKSLCIIWFHWLREDSDKYLFLKVVDGWIFLKREWASP